MDLYVVAYGNERYNETTDKYTCQHGPEECYMNLVGRIRYVGVYK